VAAEEEATPITFSDLAGVVYYLRMVPWEVEGFDAVADEETLRRIHRRIRDEGSLIIRGAHMLIEATKTGGR
jgi:hypothetical protein